MLFQISKKQLACAALSVAVALALAGCGGSGAGASGGANTVDTSSSSGAAASSSGATGGTPVPTTVKVAILSSSATLASDGKTPIDITAIVTSATNLAVADQPVIFSAEDTATTSGVRLEVIKAKTDNGGTATARLFLLSDQSERDIKVTAKSADALVAQTVIRVSGNVLTLSGPSQVSFSGTPAQFSVTLKDSSGSPVANKPVTITSSAGNATSAVSTTTDASGQAKFTLTGSKAGADTVQVTALGVSASRAINVASQSLSINSSALIIPINTDNPITVSYSVAGGIPATASAAVSTTQGTVSVPSVALASGAASFTVRSASAGPATITAVVNGNVATFDVAFVAVAPSKIDIQPSPTIIGPNLGNSTTQRSQIIATVRDVAGNPVANQTVTFTATQNPSGGKIEPSSALTDFAGRATVAYIAGPNTSPPNGIQISATVVSNGILSAPTNLSVSQQGLFVRIGTNNLVEKLDKTFYRVTYGVIVTDATGNPIANAPVQIKIKPVSYALGYWGPPTIATSGYKDQVFVINPLTSTPWYGSEDVNGDGQCTPSLDINSDGKLTPGNVAVAPQNIQTDASGKVEVPVDYQRSYAHWVQVSIEASTTVGGSEGRASDVFLLPIAKDDTAIAAATPGEISPFPYANSTGKKCGVP
jgi:Bacterial Ig-like domain (group 1)